VAKLRYLRIRIQHIKLSSYPLYPFFNNENLVTICFFQMMIIMGVIGLVILAIIVGE